MAAEQRVEAPGLVLLLEPDKPSTFGPRHRWRGWRTEWEIRGRCYERVSVREHGDDAWGAAVQHMIARYAIQGERRGTLAREFVVSERQVQAYLGGQAWRSYGDPVLRALAEMGVTPQRGNWSTGSPRSVHLVAALRRLSAEAADLLAGLDEPEAQRVAASLRLLSGAWREGRP